MTLNFAIGKNIAEGKTHMMCIDGTEGETLCVRIYPLLQAVPLFVWIQINAEYLIVFTLITTPSVSDCENPKPSQTELKVLEYGTYDGEPVTKVLLQPLTGIT